MDNLTVKSTLPQRAPPPPPRQALGIEGLDRFLQGGLPVGSLCEWGVPWGQGGRELLLRGLGRLTARAPGMRALWVGTDKHLSIYQPAWEALGVPTARWRFAVAERPVAELKPVLLEPLFGLLVLDAPRTLSSEDCAFLARQAREHRQIVLLLRDAWLGAHRGNVFARLRLNCRYEPKATAFRLSPVRGLPPGDVCLPRSEL